MKILEALFLQDEQSSETVTDFLFFLFNCIISSNSDCVVLNHRNQECISLGFEGSKTT